MISIRFPLYLKRNSMIVKLLIPTLFVLFSSYNITKSNIIVQKNTLKKTYHSSTNKPETLNSIRLKFTSYLSDTIIPNWYETKWSFDGYSETPKKGTIACGYFVSTTLRDVGCNINRFKLAQKAPLEEAKVIACGNEVTTLKNKSKAELKNYFITKRDGLYFIGLQFHVGYIFKKENDIYFIHSNYIDNKGVMKEKIDDSKAIISDVYYIADITYNDKLLTKWLNNEVISTN